MATHDRRADGAIDWLKKLVFSVSAA